MKYLLFIAWVFLFCNQGHTQTKYQIGDKSPNFSALTTTGDAVTLKKLKGKIIVLDFWFIGCGPCRSQMPKLTELAKVYSSQAVVYLGISPDSSVKVKKFVELNDFDIPQIPDAKKIFERFGVTRCPTHLVIDQKGIIRHIRTGGGADPEQKQLIQIIDQLLIP